MSFIQYAFISQSGTEAEAALCCCVSFGDTNIDIQEETVWTAAVSIKIGHFFQEFNLFHILKEVKKTDGCVICLTFF